MTFRVKVMDIALDQPLTDITGLDGYNALQGLVRLHHTPIGYVKVPVTDDYCAATAIGQAILDQCQWPIIRHFLADGLAAPSTNEAGNLDWLNAPHPLYNSPWPLVTVAVCTRDRPTPLADCLAALSRLDYPALDLLVIDNAPSTPATAHLVRRQYPQVRYVCESIPGLNWARNRAIAEARGDILAYTDDDVIVDAHWVRALARVFAEQPEVMAVTGLVVPYELETEAQQLFERYGGFGRGFEPRTYRVDRECGERTATHHGGAGKFGTGANMAYRCSVFAHIGPFDPALDVGTVTNGGGDLEMFFRVLQAGHTLAYEPSALVRHRHRRDYAQLRTQITNNGIGFYAYLVRSALHYRDERWALARLGLWWLWWWNIRRLLISLRQPERFPRDLIMAELWGSLRGLGRYPKARRAVARMVHSGAVEGAVR